MTARHPIPVTPVTQGRSNGSSTVASFRLTEGAYGAGQTLPRHAHARAAATIVLSGSVTETCDRRQYRCSPWSILIKPAGEPHSDIYGTTGATCLFIEMAAVWLRRAQLPHQILDRTSFLPPSEASPIARGLYREARLPDAATPLAIEGLLLELLAALVRWPQDARRAETPPWLHRAIEFIHDAFGSSLRVADIASHAGVHPMTLARAFRERHGRSPAEYLRDVRLAWARGALQRSSRPVAEIAVAAGFSDQSHFTRVFTRRFALPPSQYRRRYGVQAL